MLSKTAFDSFIEELYKLAALDPEEQKLFREITEKQREFDRMAGSDDMSEAQKAAHRSNTERMRHFLNKKKDSKKEIPPWAKDLNAEPPEDTFKVRNFYTPGGHTANETPSKFIKFIVEHPYGSAAALGGISGGLLSGMSHALRTQREQEIHAEIAKERGPASEFIAKNPVLGGAAYGAVSMPLKIEALRRALTRTGKPYQAAAMFLAPNLGLIAVDKGLKAMRASRPAVGPQVPSPQKAA